MGDLQMGTLKQLCKPRPSVFDRSRRDVVLDLTDLVEDRIEPAEFFRENHPTEGMKRLLREAFRRFEGQAGNGVVKLTQAMGGGKTHSMIALGLLAKHPEFRKPVMGDLYQAQDLGPVRVVAFTGRESDAPLGIWGSIAEQLGKKEVFKDYYAPLSAPGQTAWKNLLAGEPLLILLDELPPYFENAASRPIGNSDLAVVTTTALSNLLVAVGKDELRNVCVVLSDLRSTYESGSQRLSRALENLADEVGRSALNLEPVGLNTDEVYHILRKRLFEDDGLPGQEDVLAVGRAYAQAVRDAKQMDITNAPPEKFAQQIAESYPFHPALRDLYARFRENPGFQQTRGLIRLMRIVVSRLYEGSDCRAGRVQLIHAHDLDLNDRETLAEITSINPTLDNAISHDLASNGQAVAENMDANLGTSDTSDAARLILVSSLANVPNAVVGLTLSEIVAYLCAPGRDPTKLKEVLGTLSTKAWYLHSNREGKLFFRNVQNLVAKLKTTADSYNRESSLKELRTFLQQSFTPTQRDCYQEVRALPPVDEIQVSPDKVTLVLYEPYAGGLHPDLQKFYDDLDCKNRIAFLSGQRDTLETLLEVAREYKAISYILEEMDKEKVPDSDPQRATATDLFDKVKLRLLSAARETFTRLTYPHGDQLMNADFLMNFTGNEYRGEQQVREALKGKQKFTEDVTGDTFRKKCEARLFTQKAMLWSEVKRRAAMNTNWQWHRPDALDLLKEDLCHKDQWREEGGYVEKGPFPLPSTGVRVQELDRNSDTGEVTLKLTPVHGDALHHEVGAPATAASGKVADPKCFKTTELEVSFLCTDSAGQHETGAPVAWRNRLTIKSRAYQNGADKMAELRAAPPAPIRYTSDGSDPKLQGGAYDGPFAVPKGTVCVLAVAEKNGLSSEVHRLDIDWSASDGFKVDPEKPALWRREHSPKTSKETYELLARLRRHGASVPGPRVSIVGEGWLELNFDDKLALAADQLEPAIENLRGFLPAGQVALDARSLRFPTGQNLLDWVNEVKTELKRDEVEQ